jgi:flagellar basal-body rod modification protein FlgD
MIMHKVAANYTLPTVLNTLNPSGGIRKTLNAKSTTAPSTGSTSGSTTASGIGSTFLSLLATELENQDPTAPVDSTAMVGQMISLNQLDQLISINQTVTGSSGTGTTGLLQSAGPAGDTALSPANGGGAGTLSPSVSGAASNQLPFDPATMMPLASGNAGAVAAAINSSINASTMGSSTTSTNNSGGK